MFHRDVNMTHMAALPYTSAPGNIEKALRAIQSAATPSAVSQDFVKTILKIPGGSGNQVTSFLRKVGFVSGDGSPSDLYRRFRNPSTAGRAAADALRFGYEPLYSRNEYMHQLSDDKLRGLILEETGYGDGSAVVGWVMSSIKAIKKFADWSDGQVKNSSTDQSATALAPAATNSADAGAPLRDNAGRIGLNLSYTINLNLPASPDIAVFNAIFKSLKDNLLKGVDE
jgi:hypothetical protein